MTARSASPRGAVGAAAVARSVVLGVVPALILIAHFFFGAALDLPALTMFAVLSLVLAVALAAPVARGDLARMTPLWGLALPFAAVLAAAGLSLTPLAPGGPHPMWEWAGLPPASTLNRSATIVEVVKLLGLAAVFILGCLMGARSERARAALVVLLGLGAIYATISLAVFLAGLQPTGFARLTGGFYSANIAATQFGVLLVLTTAWLVRQWSRTGRMPVATRIGELTPALALILLFTVCLLLTASRAGIAATMLALALFLGWAALDNKRSRWALMAGGGFVILCVVVLIVQGNGLFADRYGDLPAGDTTRAAVAQAHWRAFLDSPLMGYGLGSYAQVNNQIMTTANAEALAASVVQHNAYLQWLEEAGLIGAVPMFGLIAAILGVTAWRAWRRPRNRVLVVGLLAVSVLVLLHAAVDVSLNTPSFEAFWTLLLGFGFALSQARSRDR